MLTTTTVAACLLLLRLLLLLLLSLVSIRPPFGSLMVVSCVVENEEFLWLFGLCDQSVVW